MHSLSLPSSPAPKLYLSVRTMTRRKQPAAPARSRVSRVIASWAPATIPSTALLPKPPRNTRRSATDLPLLGAPHPRVQHVPQGVAQEVEAQHGQADGDPGEDGHPGGNLEKGAGRTAKHASPRRSGWRDPKTQEAQGGLHQDCTTQLDGDQHDNGRSNIREQVPQDNAP